MEGTGINIDFAGIATDLMASLGPAVLAAIGVGAAILVARLGWRFFKSFAR